MHVKEQDPQKIILNRTWYEPNFSVPSESPVLFRLERERGKTYSDPLFFFKAGLMLICCSCVWVSNHCLIDDLHLTSHDNGSSLHEYAHACDATKTGIHQ